MAQRSRNYRVTVGDGGVPVAADADVLVVGGGTAGVVAALAAARNGAKTMLIENLGFLGGSQSAALVTPIMDFHCDGKPLIAGIHLEMIDRINALGENEGVWHNPEALKRVYEDMCAEASVELRYYTQAVDVMMSGKSIAGVLAASKAGLEGFLARQVIDCTGDADVAVAAGVPFQKGRESDGMNQPASLRFIAGGVDAERLASFLRGRGHPVPDLAHIEVGYAKGGAQNLGELWEAGAARGEIPAGEEGVYIQFFTLPGCPGLVAFNCPRVCRVDGTDSASLTWAAIEGRKRIERLLGFCQRNLPGFEKAFVALSAPMVGIRESRRIEGEYTLTVHDFMAAAKFPDAVAKSRYPVDIHNPDREGVTVVTLPPGDYHDIPYRCLVPKDVNDLLVAGRCVSATFEAQAAIRVQANCRALGEAAGTAAAMCVAEGVTPRRLNRPRLIERLRAQGARAGAS